MHHYFSYRDNEIYSHHTVDITPNPESHQMHAHEWMEIFYFISGKGSYLVEGTQYELTPGDILIMRAAETHKLQISPDEPYERIAIHFPYSLIQGFDPDGRLLRPFTERQLGQHNHYRAEDEGTRELAAAFSSFRFDTVSEVKLNLIGRLLLLLTTLSGIYERASGTEVHGGGFQRELVRYVNEHLFEDISLQSVSDHFYRSRSQISRVFRQATGSALWEYVTIKRLLSARAMLERGESAGDACAQCGFSDYSTFFRAYRAHFGHSPKEDAGA